VGEPTPSQLLPAGHIEETQHETQLFLGRCGEQLLAGPVFAQQQTDQNAPVKLNKQEIIRLQQTLDQKGFNVGKPDGIWGSKTSGELKEFQKQNNLPATGMSDQQTLADLGINVSMQNNSNASAPQNTGRSVSTQRPRKGSNPQQSKEPSGSSDTYPSNPSSGGNGNM
jgi:peptidoglycan hydrolase-like protein with peptidoglycan-binding domain